MDMQQDGVKPDGVQPDSVKLAVEIGDAFGELFEQMAERFEELAKRFSLPAFCLKALHMLGSPMAMKELGQRFHCDPSFVTAIADMLDSHGLSRRETDTRDRRIKNLLLTPKGLALRERVEREMATFVPWAYALEPEERQTLLRLLRKMIKAEHERRAREGATPLGKRLGATARSGRGKVTGRLTGATPPVTAAGFLSPPGKQLDATAPSGRGKVTGPPTSTTPPVAAGGYRVGEVTPAPGAATPGGN